MSRPRDYLLENFLIKYKQTCRSVAGQLIPEESPGSKRVGRWVIPRRSDPTESAAENIPPVVFTGKGEKVR